MTTKQKNLTLGWIICTLAMIFYAYEFLLRISPSVMAQELEQFFNLSAAGFGSLVGLYYLAYTPMQLFVGPIVDLFGPRKVLTLAILFCALGALVFATTHSLFIAGVGRFLIGFGSAFAFVGALKLAAVWLPLNRFATFAGLVTALGMLGGMLGDNGLTALVAHVGWRQTMLYGALVGLILAPIIAIIVRNHPANTPQEKLVHHAWWAEFLKIVKQPQLWSCGFVACMLYLSLSAFAEIWGIPFLRGAFGFTAQQAGAANSMVFFGWLIGGPLAGWASDKLQKRRLPLLIGTIISGLCISAVLYLPLYSLLLIQVLLFIFGLFSSAEVVCFAIGQESAPKEVTGTVIAFVNMLTMLGGFVFQPLIGKFLDLSWSGQIHDGVRYYTSHDFRLALSVIPIGLLISLILIFTMRETYHAPETNTEKSIAH